MTTTSSSEIELLHLLERAERIIGGGKPKPRALSTAVRLLERARDLIDAALRAAAGDEDAAIGEVVLPQHKAEDIACALDRAAIETAVVRVALRGRRDQRARSGCDCLIADTRERIHAARATAAEALELAEAA